MKHQFTILLVFCFLLILIPTKDVFCQEIPEFQVQVTYAKFLGKTKPIRDIPLVPLSENEKKEDFEKNRKYVPNFYNREIQALSIPGALPIGQDPVWQSGIEKNNDVPIFPIINVDGMTITTAGGATPPDPCGDIGPDHYIQLVNSTRWQVFDKTGMSVSGVMSANNIWAGLGVNSLGDPIILYDQEVDRWIFTEFSDQGDLLVAISDSGDPMGSWNGYSFNTPNFPDYPKYSVWTNAYVLTTNEQGTAAQPIYFLDRQAMLNGDANVIIQRITVPGIPGGPGFQVATPVDWSGMDAPPVDALPMIVRLNDDSWGQAPSDRVEVWEFDVDFSNSANTTMASTNVITAAYDSRPCAAPGPGFACIPQMGGTGIDGLPEVIMHQAHYRNFGTHESIVLNFITDADGNNLSGIRWVEMRRTSGNSWSLYQEGTFAPLDGNHRFMGGIGIDGFGNIGLAYSISGPNIFPGIAFTGRRAGDPLGQMTIDEYIAADGETSSGSSRYGDYASMSVDPSDDKTFWFTGEYIKSAGWGTRILAFQLGRDTTDIGPVALLTPISDSQLSDETVSIRIQNYGLDTISSFEVGYIFESGTPVVEPVSYTLYPDSFYTHTFGPTVSMPTIGTYDFEIFTSLVDDTNAFNNTLTTTVKHLPRWDAGISGVIGLEELICAESVEADLIIKNYGTETLTSLTITYLINFMNPQVINWTGSIPGGQTGTTTVLLQNYHNGTNSFNATCSNPNGQTDQVVSNNSHIRPFMAIINGEEALLTISTDLFPNETSWQLADTMGNILFQGGPYPGMAQQDIEEILCIDPNGCFVFTMFDTFGDGIQAYGVFGDYQIQNPDGLVVASLIQANFGNSEVNPFCMNPQCMITADVDVSPTSGPDNSDGTILLVATSGVGPFQFSVNNGQDFQPFGFFGGLAVGTYQIVILDSNGCTYTEEVEVEFSTSIVNLEGGQSIRIYPNPTEGIFKIDVLGLDHVDLYLQIEIFDAMGRLIQHAHITRYDNMYTGEIGLVSYPAGVYFVKFNTEEMNRLVPVVKN